MDDLAYAVELIDRVLEALERAETTNPELRETLAQRSTHLQQLRDETENAQQSASAVDATADPMRAPRRQKQARE